MTIPQSVLSITIFEGIVYDAADTLEALAQTGITPGGAI
jgi:hypothetical protein